jgi:hypothetical protein
MEASVTTLQFEIVVCLLQKLIEILARQNVIQTSDARALAAMSEGFLRGINGAPTRHAKTARKTEVPTTLAG